MTTELSRRASTTPVDPIFAAIEAHRAANLEWTRLIDENPDQDHDDASEREDVLCAALWRTMPTTATGFAALFAYMASPRWPRGAEDTNERHSHFQDAVDVAWCSEFSDGNGDGGVPALHEWLKAMETALKRMTLDA